MPPLPKPSKKDRIEKKQEQVDALHDYRRVQSALAISRDNDQCVICWFMHHRKRKRAEIHHVYSRSREAGDWREQYTSLMCVCKECHPQPIKILGGSANLSWIEDVLRQANETPINPHFNN